MHLKLTKVLSITSLGTAVGAAVFFFTAAGLAEAKDWRLSMDRHDAAAKTIEDEGLEWGFTLNEVVADMAWRQRTAEILRNTPRPSSEPNARSSGPLADRPAPSRLRFAF